VKHYKLGEFCQFLNVKPPCTNVKPLLKTFWWRFCVYDFETSYGSGSWLQFNSTYTCPATW